MTRFPIINWWISRKMENPHLILAIIGSLACLFGEFGGYPAVTVFGTRFLTVLAVIHLVHVHLHCFWQYLQDYQSCDRLPLHQMKRINAFLMMIFLLAFGALLVIGWHLPWKAAGSFLGGLILAVIRWLVRLLPYSEEELVQETSQSGGLSGMPDLPAGTASPVAQFLEQAAAVIALAVTVMIILRLFWRGLLRLAEYIGNVHLAEDEMVFLKPESVRRNQRESGKKFFRNWHLPGFERTREGRIRRMYWKCIQEWINPGQINLVWANPGQMDVERTNQGNPERTNQGGMNPGQAESAQVRKGSIDQKQAGRVQEGKRRAAKSLSSRSMCAMTPYQLEQAAGIWDSEEETMQKERFHFLYEKARYSQEGCSREEEQQMKECCRSLNAAQLKK